MAIPADFTVRARDEMFSIYVQYQALFRRIEDLNDEVTALGGAAGIYGADGSKWPVQADGFTLADMGNAFANLTKLIGAPTLAHKQTIIRTRRG